MTTIDKLSVSESAARILKKLESECGFGLCAGDPACRDKHCPGHPGKRTSLTGDVYLLNTAAPRQSQEQSEVLSQWRATQQAQPDVETFDVNPWYPRAIAAAVLFVLACIALAPEIAGLLTALNH